MGQTSQSSSNGETETVELTVDEKIALLKQFLKANKISLAVVAKPDVLPRDDGTFSLIAKAELKVS